MVRTPEIFLAIVSKETRVSFDLHILDRKLMNNPFVEDRFDFVLSIGQFRSSTKSSLLQNFIRENENISFSI